MKAPDPLSERVPTAPAVRGRGAAANPANRFARVHVERDPDPEGPAPATVFLRDTSRSILVRNESPDLPFSLSLNPYRGCEHGCIYCYARPYHEYLGFSAGLDFETRILVKEDAPRLLEEAFASPSYVPEPIAIAGVTDAWQPVERRLGITRRCLEVLARHRHPVGVVTKNRLVVRDADLLGELASHRAASACVSVTSLDPRIAATLEPRASRPAARLDAIRGLADAGVPVGVIVAPVVPGLTDHEIPAILRAAARAGATFGGYEVLRLPHALAGLFEGWLDRHQPERKAKVLSRLRSLRGGRLDDPRFGTRMSGEGPFATQIRRMFETAARRAGLEAGPTLSDAAFRRPGTLF